MHFGETNPILLNPTHDHRLVFMGPGSRYARPGRRFRLGGVKHQPAAAENEDRRRSLFRACSLQGTVQLQRVEPQRRPFSPNEPNRVLAKRPNRILTKAEPGAILDSLAPRP